MRKVPVPPPLLATGSSLGSERGCGVFTTAQQTALAVGVATMGSLYAELASAMGPRDGFLVVIAVHALLTAGVVLLSRRLPDPRS